MDTSDKNTAGGLAAQVRSDDGLTTAEYAVGTVAVAGLGGIFIKLLTSDWALELIKRVIEWAFSSLFS